MSARVKTFFEFVCLSFLFSSFSFLFSSTLLRSLARVVLLVLLISAFTTTARFVIFRSASVRPRHLIDQNVDHDYFFKLPLQGVGCPFTVAVCYFPPCLVPSCPTYEPNSKEGEYSHPFRHIQYNRIAIRRPIATFAMLLCRRIARCR